LQQPDRSGQTFGHLPGRPFARLDRAFDVAALERFGYPAARVRPTGSGSIESLEDLLEGEVKDANGPAAALGVEVGMRGREALDLL